MKCLDRNRCLYCGSSSVNYVSHTIVDGFLDGRVAYSCKCDDCGRDYVESYDMVYAGKEDDEGNEYEVSEDF